MMVPGYIHFIQLYTQLLPVLNLVCALLVISRHILVLNLVLNLVYAGFYMVNDSPSHALMSLLVSDMSKIMQWRSSRLTAAAVRVHTKFS